MALVDPFDMLKTFVFMSMFIAENCFFLTASSSSREFRSHRAGSLLKIITYQWDSIQYLLNYS